MGDRSRIEWTETTWNPIVGCSKVSPGCGLPRFDGDRAGGCYAIRMAARLQRLPAYTGTVHHTGTGLDWTGTVHCLPGRLREPLSWRRPRMVFLNSMSDLSGGVTILVSSLPQLRGHARPSLCLRHMSRTGTGASLLSACRSGNAARAEAAKPGSASPITGLAAGAL